MDSSRDWDLVAQTLGNLPLALAQARSYMATTKTSPSEYLRIYREQQKLLLNKRPPKALWQYGESILSTWEVFFSSIERASPSTARPLLLCGYFQPENIPYLFFKFGVQVEGRRADVWEALASRPTAAWRKEAMQILKKKSRGSKFSALTPIKWLQDLVVDETLFQDSVNLLLDYSMVTDNNDKSGLILHPQVHSWCYHREIPDRVELLTEAVCLAGRAVDFNHHRPHAWRILQDFQPHVRSCGSMISKVNFPTLTGSRRVLDLAQATEAIGNCLQNITRSDEDCLVLELCLGLSRAALGKVHDEQCRQLLHVLTLAVIDQLASVLQEEERLTEAEALRRELSILSRQALGEGKSDYWSFQYKLGGLLAEQGKYAAAQVIFEKVIAFRGGKDREESVVGLMVNLGAALKEQGKLDDAEELLIDARRQAALMKDKLRFQLHATEALGDVCEAQGHPEKTKELYSSTLDTLKANFSMEDPLDLVWHVT